MAPPPWATLAARSLSCGREPLAREGCSHSAVRAPIVLTSLAILAGAAPALAGCGEQPAAPATAPGDLLLLRAGAERTLALGAGAPRALPAGQPAVGWRSLYTATPSGGATRVARVEVTSGRTLGSLRLPGRWTLPATVIGGAPDAASADGRTIVLARAGARAARFALVDASLRRPPRTITLPGRFAFDAIAPDAKRMFLIEQRPGGHYLVRDYDLARGELEPGAVVDKAEPDEPMEGQPVARAVPRTGPWVYTLYRKAEGPFVHALNTEGFALCLDLPAVARSGPAAAGEWGLALVPGDHTLYAANPALGLVVEIGTGDNPGIRRTGRIPGGAIGAAPRLAVAPDGETLYVPTARGVVAVDTAMLKVRRTLLRGHRVSAVVASGRRLYAQDGAVVTLDAASGSVLRRTPTSAPPAALAAVVPASRQVLRGR
jgi:outer membrane protein assembly factor BamB